ncbi:hypothetical protein KIW84_050605 [Lathyrus oleraceus]|uniref:Retrovirus-related Pol polyprotein from transposon TNT 1-94-like beta-barrel domain-containing protein n=1 Tax=Pisum sativum TaxID=3888 RepID=A0A9D4WHV1_PEA|nr:hypothetical protein KIW84_050605 [Pisum sativum]
MSENKEWFMQLDESFRNSVKIGNNSKLEVIGKGNIRLEFGGRTQINWVRDSAQSKSDVLGWGEAYKEALEELDGHEDENTTSEVEEENFEVVDSSSNEVVYPPTLERRGRRIPTYLQDYTGGGELSEDEVQNFLMFMSTDDPIYYEETMKTKNWRDVMNMEITAIIKNQT